MMTSTFQADRVLAHATGAHGIPVLFYPAISGNYFHF
jgi:hypothetical protein